MAVEDAKKRLRRELPTVYKAYLGYRYGGKQSTDRYRLKISKAGPLRSLKTLTYRMVSSRITFEKEKRCLGSKLGGRSTGWD